jgi:putative ABC transport system permease protein
MNPLDLFRFSSQAVLQNRRRSTLSLLGVVIGVIAVVSLTAVGEGALRFVIGGIPNDLTLRDTLVLERRIQSIRTAVPLSVSTDTISYLERDRQVPIVGATSEFARLQQLELAMGSFLPESEFDRGASVVVLGHTVANELFDDVNPLGSTVRIGGWRMRVIGVLQERGTQLGMQVDESVFIPTASGMRMANKSSVNRIMLELFPKADADLVIERVKEILIERHDEEDFTCISQDAVMSSLASILGILTMVVAGIASVSLAVAGIGIMNVMLVSVSERTDEVGLLKAVGANQRQILMIFLLEAVILSVAGAVLGLGLGTALVFVGNSFYPAVDAVTPPWAIGAVILLALGTGVVFGVLPAWRASRLDPVAALQGR